MNKQPEAEAFDAAVGFSDPAAIHVDAAAASAPGGDADEAAAEAPGETAPGPSRSKKLVWLAGLKHNLPLVIATLGVFTSLMATVGLLVASRNVAEASQRIAALETAVKQASEARPAAAAAPLARLHGPPMLTDGNGPARAASAAEIRAALDDLRRDLVRYQSTGSNALWIDAIRDGQGEIANRINAIGEKVDRIERRLNGGRPASPVADQARPS